MTVAVIPFKPKNPKTRLSCVLDEQEREAFAEAMLLDVVEVVRDADCQPVILGTELFDSDLVQVTIKDAGLSEALNEYLSCAVTGVLIIMADLPLADKESVRRVIGTKMDMAIVPGRGGGTNVIYLKDPARFHVDYYGGSYLKHMKIAQELGLSCEVIDSFLLHTDIDEKEDLVEILIHGTGKSHAFLLERGFTITTDKGRVGVERKSPN
ncbi:MAG: 2-phospho-L-lactate guanylyltransferase [Methanoregula sp.]|nr:2-phospho-L-lactate guanylyltransferase [Methanoregula sp.]